MLLELFFPNFDVVAIAAGIIFLLIGSILCNIQDIIMPVACMGIVLYILIQ